MTFASGTIYYVPVTITNSQTTATPSTFQTMVTVNSSNYTTYLASNLSNVNWQDGAGNILNSWLESGNSNTSTSSIYWVKLTTSIPANSSTTIYLCFYATSTNNFNTTNTGEAPTLSGTYGQYDNGSNVFSNYWNFAGTSLPSGWNAVTLSASVNNGVTLTGAPGGYLYYSGASYSGSVVTDSQYSVPSLATTNGYGEGFAGITATSPSWVNTFSGARTQSNGSGGLDLGYVWNGTYTQTATTVPTSSIVMTFLGSSSGMAALHNYSSFATSSGALPTSYYLAGANVDGGTVFLQWLRSRAYPPNATMPSDSFGEVGAVSGTGPSLLMSLTTQ